MSFISNLKEGIINKGMQITREDALKLYSESSQELFEAADEIRSKLCGKAVDLCSIINGKSGLCSENCKYCAQSKHYCTGVEEYPLLPYENIKEEALVNQNGGVNRFSIVTSGRALGGRDLDKVIEYYKKLNNECTIELCASHGILDKDALMRLKEAGVKRYHHNIESSRNYYGKICTSHSFDDRINTIKNAQEVGMEVCSGGIIGMGESREDRVDMAIELRNLGISSIPVNILSPIKGTPLENIEQISEEEILRTISVFRFINPKSDIRLAGGRIKLEKNGYFAFKSGANATITGNLLTTSGNGIADDREMITGLGFKLI